MRTLLNIVLGLVVLGGVALLAFIAVPVQPTPPQQQVAADWQPEEGQGEYAMRLADCAACHTAPGGERFAGGRAIESPLGTIYSSNITPDDETGIGGWSLEDFRAALYDGMRPDGTHLYPAMPYENYRKLTEEDVRALYHYFIEEVEPVQNAAPEADLPFPFDQRWTLRGWKWLALDEPGFRADTDDPVLARGEYIVEGPGHCSACHTPRNAIMAEAAVDTSDEAFLSGGEIAGWTAPALRGPGSAIAGWSQEDLVAIFSTGRNAHAAVNGEMQLVIQDSTQYMSEEDLAAMSAYLVGLNEGVLLERSEDVTETEALIASADPDMPLGARLYIDNCNACHFANGRGADEVFPELDGNSLVTAESPTGLISMILGGSELPSTPKRPYSLRMPGFSDRLTDEEVAELASFVRQGWSNDAAVVSADDVADLRGEAEAKVE
ncbi:cytochrome c [Phaeobacter sp. 22II1-1F12B]|uniref:cytochrome c n=1 Tax=Phaeobacter sp. 22II1-1F12B TaxID=1317111 RepID=UPI000B524B16|nr:cytochrome c [Phaeobacter sp. 22II1-1F12B]OWU72704.1 cytochrome C [Phaeobacter sp. 22II1-1F12B]